MEFKRNGNIVDACTHHVVFCPKDWRTVPAHCVDERLKVILRVVGAETASDVLEPERMPLHPHLWRGVDSQLGICLPVWWIGGRSSLVMRNAFP